MGSFLAIVAFFLFSIPASAKIIDYIVAVVNGEPILYSELISYAKENRIPDLEKARDSLIEKKILLTEAKEEGLTVSNEEVEKALKDFMEQSGFKTKEELKRALRKEGLTLEEVKAKIREQLLVAKLIASKVKPKVKITDLEVEKACRRENSFRVREVCYIFTKNKDKAEKALKALKAGAPFEKVAKEYSEDPVTAKKGGYLGKVRKGTLIKPLDTVVWSTEPGKFNLIQTKDGYFIVYVKSERSKGCNREKIRRELYTKKFQETLKAFIEELKKKASVKVYI
jgi:parvulin-like peptidyl-prolyl isomerase